MSMMRTKVDLIIKAVIFLILIQVSRAGIACFMEEAFPNLPVYTGIALLLIGLVLYTLIRPKLSELGLDFQHLSHKERKLYCILGTLLLLLIIASPVFYSGQPALMLVNLESVLCIPVCEELIFRGYLWNRFELVNMNKTGIYILILLLFGFWHLGYWDVIEARLQGIPFQVNMVQIMFYKVMVGLGYGILTGLIRYKSKNIFGCILLHSFLNIFGR